MSASADDREARGWIRRWLAILVISCVGMVALVVASLWALNGFHGLGLHPSTALALILGTIGATVLGVALMGLVFYSDRSGVDAAVRDASSERKRIGKPGEG